MKITYSRHHTTRPEDYESVLLSAKLEIDSENEADAEYFEGDRDLKGIGKLLSEDLDLLLDSDVDRALRLDGQHTEDSHLWAFYEKD